MVVQLWSYSRGRICGGNTARIVLSWSSSYGPTPGVVFAGVIPLGSYCHERPAMVVLPGLYLRGGNTVRTVLSWSSSYGRTPGDVFAGVIPLGSYCHERPAMVVFPESYLRG
ncbi:hypothetical protein J6590_079185 [Homalodisca vitripennis]|nr:hypothetical protein J6590_079185 [Homalodisca vitripennis]